MIFRLFEVSFILLGGIEMKTIHFPTELWVGEGALANLETLMIDVFSLSHPFMVDSGFVE